MDGLLLRKLIKKVKEIEGEKIEQIYGSKKELYFQTKSSFIHISLNPFLPFILLSDNPNFETSMPDGFTMFLRNTIKNSQIECIEQIGYDRVVIIKLIKRSYPSELKRYEMIVELMGKFSNLILVDTDTKKILIAHKMLKTKYRDIIPGVKYKPYPKTQMNPECVNFRDLVGLKGSDLYGKLEGFSDILTDEILYRLNIKKDQILDQSMVNFVISTIQNILTENNKVDGVYVYDTKEKILLSPIEIHHLRHLKYEYIDNVFSGIENVLKEIKIRQGFIQMKRRMVSMVRRKIEKIEQTLKMVKHEYEKSKEYEKYRKYGEILKSNIQTAIIRSNNAVCMDWETGNKVTIPIDKDKSIMENAQIYFKLYKKMLKRINILNKRIEELEIELEDLKNTEKFVLMTKNLDQLKSMEDEMLSNESEKKGESERTKKILQFEKGGFVILVGRNAKQNDFLTFKLADLNDLWFHARNVPGSHVILKKAGRKPDDDVIEFAARLAATFSKASGSSKVEVDMTEVKNLKKPKNSKEGFVLYRNHRTLLVKPFENLDPSYHTDHTES